MAILAPPGAPRDVAYGVVGPPDPRLPNSATVESSGTAAVLVAAHAAAGDPHSGYALLAGRAGTANNWTISTDGTGIIRGSAAAGGGLDLVATTHATDGPIRFLTDPSTEAARFLATGELLVGRTTLGQADLVEMSKNQNGYTTVRIINETVGTAAAVAYGLSQDGINVLHGALSLHSAAYTASGSRQPAQVLLRSELACTGGLGLAAQGANRIAFWTNDVERARFLPTGELLIGRTTLVSAFDIMGIERNQNTFTVLRVINTTAGTAAIASVGLRTNAADIGFEARSSAYTAAGQRLPGSFGMIGSLMPNGITIGVMDVAPISFWTNDIERARFLGTANTLQGSGGFTLEGGAGAHTLTLRGGATQTTQIALAAAVTIAGNVALTTPGSSLIVGGATAVGTRRLTVASDLGKADATARILVSLTSSETFGVGNPNVLEIILTGAALQANRIWDIQTGESGVANGGRLRLQAGAGDVGIGGATGKIGFYGVAEVARSTGWTITNDVTDRAFNADSGSIFELADVVATLIRDIAATGLVGAVA